MNRLLCALLSLSLGFAVTVSAEAPAKAKFKVISQGRLAGSYQAFPDICRTKQGELACVFYAGYDHISLPAPDFPKGGRICMVRSDDDGQSWGEPTIVYDDINDNRDPHIAQLSDGTLICSFFSFSLKANPVHWSAQMNKPIEDLASIVGVQMVRSTTGGETWQPTSTTVVPGWACSAPVREVSSSLCVMGIYQENPRAGTAWGGVIRSTDMGKTWGLPIEIGKGQNLYLDAETDIVPLKNGWLFAALRSSKGNMFYARSRDGGKTWSTPKDIGFPAHCPHFTRLKSGVILMSHRIPQTALHISRDEGQTWEGPFIIDDSANGAYPSTVELRDGSVLAVYYTEGEHSVIRAKKFRVTPDGIALTYWE